MVLPTIEYLCQICRESLREFLISRYGADTTIHITQQLIGNVITTWAFVTFTDGTVYRVTCVSNTETLTSETVISMPIAGQPAEEPITVQ